MNLKKYINQLLESFNKTKLLFKENIQGVDFAGILSISKFNKEISFLLSVIDIFSKYAWVVPLKGKKGVKSTEAVKKFI